MLDPAQRENALAFTAYLRENGLTPQRWFGPGFWIVPSKNGNLFGIHFYGLNPKANNRGWVLWFFAARTAASKDQELAEFVWGGLGDGVKSDAACAFAGSGYVLFRPVICKSMLPVSRSHRQSRPRRDKKSKKAD